MPRFRLVTVFIALSSASCQSTDKGSEVSSRRPSAQTVSGYDSSGTFVSMPPPKKGTMCAAVVDPFVSDCQNAGGTSIPADQCQNLCSVKVTAGTVSGYDSTGTFVTMAAANSGTMCAAVVDPFVSDCQNAGGTSIPADQCQNLCSVKVTAGLVQGFNEIGEFVSLKARDSGTMCAAVFTDFEDKCSRQGANILTADGCEVLCSMPVAKVRGFNDRGKKVTLPAVPAGEVCAAVVSSFRTACESKGGTRIGAKGCKELCSIKI
jgi:hypothetical protein